MNTVSILLIVLSAVSIGLSLFILTRIKHLVYLLEQPIVKKMSPDMKLKAVKVDDADDSRKHNHRQGQGHTGHNHNQGQNQARPQGQRPPEGQGQGGNRDRRPEGQGNHPRGDRPERGGERGERGQDNRGNDRHRDRDRDRGPRQDRGDRGDRPDRGERGERQRPRLDVFSNDSSAPVADSAPRAEQPAGERPALAPRRPLASSVDREENLAPVSAVPAAPELPPDAIFVGDDGDVQHGRRSSVKKKPRFEIDEEEAKSEEAKIQA